MVVPAVAPEREWIDLTIPAESVIGLQITSSHSSDRAQLEYRVDARVARDVRAGGRVAIPAGSRLEGVVTVAERGGKIKERARLLRIRHDDFKQICSHDPQLAAQLYMRLARHLASLDPGDR